MSEIEQVRNLYLKSLCRKLKARIAELEAEVKSLKFKVAELTNRVDEFEGKYPQGDDA